jgi:hypothetical protein
LDRFPPVILIYENAWRLFAVTVPELRVRVEPVNGTEVENRPSCVDK